jgi:thiamine-phosphate pyrophosphorylase
MKRKIESGVYLVVDSSYGEEKVLRVARESMDAGLDALQLWSSWENDDQAIVLGKKLAEIANEFSVPFVVNNDLDVAMKIGADGVHIDGRDPAPELIRKKMGTNSIVGVTCSTSMDKVLWANNAKVDYVSFCSMFPSSSVDECDLVPLSMLSEARRQISMPIFASGGINLENADQVLRSGANGIAVISAIMNASDPGLATKQLKEIASRNEKVLQQRENLTVSSNVK